MSPDGKQGINVCSLDAPHTMVWGTPGETSWVWRLDTQPDGTTRLITRIRSRILWTPMSIAFSMLMELGDFWMIRKMLHGLRERAEAGQSTSRRRWVGYRGCRAIGQMKVQWRARRGGDQGATAHGLPGRSGDTQWYAGHPPAWVRDEGAGEFDEVCRLGPGDRNGQRSCWADRRFAWY